MTTRNTPGAQEDCVGDILMNCDELETPAFVYDEEDILQHCEYLRLKTKEANCGLLFSLKPLTLVDVLRLISPCVDGFATSSLFEANLVRAAIGEEGTIHLTTPGLRPQDVGMIVELCDYISFNSLSQWGRHKKDLCGKVRAGLRINPQVSFVGDPRYDPCRKHSKLGEPIEGILQLYDSSSLDIDGLDGIHIHTNCDSPDFSELLMTVQHLDTQLRGILPRFEWVNLGGGYMFDEESSNMEQFIESVAILRSKYGLNVFIEPGAAVVREAGYLVSTVLDILHSDGKSVAILDTSINHMPEVFEYQFLPDVFGDVETGSFGYILAGSTCLAGDIFGEYSFMERLEVGSRVVFTDVGAYTLVKAHTFNGLNLPSVYALTAQGDLILKKRFTFEEYALRWGMQPHVSV